MRQYCLKNSLTQSLFNFHQYLGSEYLYSLLLKTNHKFGNIAWHILTK